MKGLLVKDFLLTTKVQGKVFGALVLFAIFMTFTTDNPFFIVSYLTFICSIFSIMPSLMMNLATDIPFYSRFRWMFEIM